MLLEIDPYDCYNWFMEFSADSYEWVMYFNIFQMIYFNSDFTTKPYISSSQYLLKMSDFPHGDWCEIWDILYFGFVNKHKKKLQKNYRFA